MFKMYFMSVLFFLSSLYGEILSDDVPNENLKIRIFTHFNGKGLESDMRILKEALDNLGQSVEVFNSFDCPDDLPVADINIYFEWITSKAIPFARLNWFVPNPEWFIDDLALLNVIDLNLCRTREVERIFLELGKPTYFLGFTSKDCFQSGVDKDYYRYLHVAGASLQKGTETILEAWKRNKHFPVLGIVRNTGLPLSEQNNLVMIPFHIPPNSLLHLQNRCGVHLCTSETEGFGHYLLEAMSTGAVVITTDAPPMNEFVSDSRCLVPYSHTSYQRLAINYYVDLEKLESTINYINHLPHEELQSIGRNNREAYLEKRQEFLKNLEKLIHLHLYSTRVI